MKFNIEYRKKLPEGYIGMNAFARKSLHLPSEHHKHPEHLIEIKKDLSKPVRIHTIRHEETEEYLMKNKGFTYHHAHQNALRFEKLNKPFPSSNIKEKLNKIGFKIK